MSRLERLAAHIAASALMAAAAAAWLYVVATLITTYLADGLGWLTLAAAVAGGAYGAYHWAQTEGADPVPTACAHVWTMGADPAGATDGNITLVRVCRHCGRVG